MKNYDLVSLQQNTVSFEYRGIQKGELGIVLDYFDEYSLIMFLNRNNPRDYACVYTNNNLLKVIGKLPTIIIKFLDKHENKINKERSSFME